MDVTVSQKAQMFEEGAALFTLLGRMLYGVPDRELFASAADLRIFDEIPFVPADRCAEARALLTKWADGCATPFAEEDFEAIRVEYTRLFVGFRKVLAPVWESVYFNRDRMVFQRQTFKVRELYARYGLEVDGLSHEPDDHLAYELLFVARLFEICRQQCEEHDETALDATLADLEYFVTHHPLMWVPMWCPLVEEQAHSDFYRGYALLVLEALKYIEEVVPVVARRAA